MSVATHCGLGLSVVQGESQGQASSFAFEVKRFIAKFTCRFGVLIFALTPGGSLSPSAMIAGLGVRFMSYLAFFDLLCSCQRPRTFLMSI